MSDLNDDIDDGIGRSEAFFERLGIARPFYTASIEAAVAFTTATAPADPAAPPWQPWGARNIGGRIRVLAQNPVNPEMLYAGSAQGGVFRSLDGGDTWQALGGPADVFPVGALAVAPSLPQRLYVGSGEQGIIHVDTGVAVVGNSQYAGGRGFFRLQEGTPPTLVREVPPLVSGAAAGAADAFARIVVDPANHERCWLASQSGLWRREAGPVFKPEPVAGALPPAPPALGAAVSDVALAHGFDLDHPRRIRVYAAIAGVGIFRGLFDPANAAAGTVWEPRLSVGLPAPCAPGAMTWDRIKLGVCAAQPQHVYAIAENPANHLVLSAYHSGDGGDTWSALAVPGIDTPPTGQAWVNLYIEPHPDNTAIVVAGALNVVRSRDFGQTWDIVIEWTNFDRGDHAQHADQHGAIYDQRDPRRLWVCNDGGISMAADIVDGSPHTDRSWRKRSHGIAAAQFNDIAVHPNHPFMLGGGLQDNGTYLSFGGHTWYSVNGGDGGQMLFEFNDPRTFVAPWQGEVDRATVIAGSAARVSGNRSLVLADRNPPEDVFATASVAIETNILAAHAPLFIPLVEHHPRSANIFLVGRSAGGVYLTTNAGNTYTRLVFSAAVTATFAGADVSALAFGIQAGADADVWIGGVNGVVVLGINNPPNATAWSAFALPAAAGSLITRIAVHPADDRYVAFCTARRGAVQQGRVFLSANRGANWTDISNLTGAGAAQAGSLPPGPCTSLAFDPQPAAAQSQVLYVGTLAGVFVVRNLPRRSPPAGAPLPAVVAQWARLNALAGPAPLPLTLVKDIRIALLPARTGPDLVANAPEAVRRVRLYAAMFGRGLYACDLTRVPAAGTPAGGPAARVYLRQTAVEDGLSYPRPTPTELNAAPNGTPFRMGGDPRFPINAVRFTDHDAFDIRIDNAPFQFFEDVIDGVEFDEDLRTRPVVAGVPNVVYVQAQSSGWQALAAVTVHLYFAPSPPPPANANAAPLPDLHADFWAHWQDPVLPAPAVAAVAPAAAWQRAGTPVTLRSIGPNQPAVARIEWLPPSTLPSHVALLAVLDTPAAVDPLTAAGQPTVMATLLRRERRAALRVAAVTPFVPDLFIRDGLDDTGRLGGVAFGGRSPDIIVVPAALADLPGTAADLANPRSADRVLPGPADNFVYVRVQNRQAVATPVDVELFWATSNPAISAAADPAGPIIDNTKWQAAAGLGPVANVVVPAKGAVLVGFKVSNVPAPQAGLPNSLAFIALIQASAGGDAKPARTRVTDEASFRRFFLQLADSNNAALRSVRYA